MIWSSWKKKQSSFCIVYFVRIIFFSHSSFVSMYSLLNALSEHTYLYITKGIISCTFLLVFEIVERFEVILNYLMDQYSLNQIIHELDLLFDNLSSFIDLIFDCQFDLLINSEVNSSLHQNFHQIFLRKLNLKGY